MFKRVLIANRGEIAVRVSRTLSEMGITSIAVYSEADRRATHVRSADEAYPLGGLTAGESYLNEGKILEIATREGVDAIHPGYGFLSENADFAQSCVEAGVTFIGPKPAVIRAMGDKVIAKQTMIDAGIPVVPGWSGDGDESCEALLAEAEKIGFPVMIKAAAGGGGKGMRMVGDADAFVEAAEAARREAGASFGDARIFLEKYVQNPRHVEFQIFGDDGGQVVHLFERECSIQRRHQKIIEESPSPVLSDGLRDRMGSVAIEAARAIGYTNAGTVEFMVDAGGEFYFLEVNTRLQVEHAVTEMITGRDLVRAQILVASGEPLPFSQEDVERSGHAIECRVYAEDASAGFLPSTGTIAYYEPPSGPNVRVDSGVEAGGEVTVFYDPMLAKLIVWDRDRARATAKMADALGRFAVLGVTTNIEFLRDVIDHPAFRAGDIHTHFLDEHEIVTAERRETPTVVWAAAAIAVRDLQAGSRTGSQGGSSVGRGARNDANASDPWWTAGAWRSLA
jgi:acetyl-CoA carboxylase biotin carboxylase subunit